MDKNNILNYINNEDFFNIELFDEITSTNDYLKKLAENGAKEGKVIISDCQIKGKGTNGRTFFSPKGTGIYLSLLLRPKDFKNFTALAGVCVCDAINELSHKNAQIKWVNDIFVENKKVCGILCESKFKKDNKTCDYLIIGIGVNVFKPLGNFPDDIKNTAGYIFDKRDENIRNELCALILNNILDYYLSDKNFLNEYRAKNFILGKKIKISNKCATAIAIDEKFRLVVKYESGEIKTLFDGQADIKF